jgi:hypothetical protein
MHALMCLGAWSKLGLVHDANLLAAATLPEVMEDEDEFNVGWDYITYNWSLCFHLVQQCNEFNLDPCGLPLMGFVPANPQETCTHTR